MKEFREVIAEIETKTLKMRSLIDDVKTENADLKSEVERLNNKLAQREHEVLDFKNKYDELLKHQEEQKEVVGKEQHENEARIDALVREIDDCINRLKAE